MKVHSRLEQRCSSTLVHLEKNHIRRFLPSITNNSVPYAEVDGRSFLNFSSNDYLGLAGHPSVIQAGNDAASTYGSGGRSSRLVTGNSTLYSHVESALARWLGFESVLIFPTGYQMNATIWKALAGKNDIILVDKWIHNSLLTGIQLSGAEWYRFRHNDLQHLQTLLEKTRKTLSSSGLLWVCTESIFSMDGDLADLGELRKLCDEFGAILVVDEAHALGVRGVEGQGCGISEELDIKLGTFGKSFGCSGAFVAASKKVIDLLVSTCDGLKYTTALPPFVLGALQEALPLIIQGKALRAHLDSLATTFVSHFSKVQPESLEQPSHIIPIMVGDNERCVQLAQFLYDHQVLAVAIRPPTVPPNSARIRCSLSAVHDTKHVLHLAQVMEQFMNERTVFE